jgi:hypothetical protein
VIAVSAEPYFIIIDPDRAVAPWPDAGAYLRDLAAGLIGTMDR